MNSKRPKKEISKRPNLECVVNSLQVERFDLLGMSQGGAVAIEYAARHPERIRRLVLFGAFARGWAKRGQEAENEAVLSLIRRGWAADNPAYRQIFTIQFMPDATVAQTKLAQRTSKAIDIDRECRPVSDGSWTDRRLSETVADQRADLGLSLSPRCTHSLRGGALYRRYRTLSWSLFFCFSCSRDHERPEPRGQLLGPFNGTLPWRAALAYPSSSVANLVPSRCPPEVITKPKRQLHLLRDIPSS